MSTRTIAYSRIAGALALTAAMVSTLAHADIAAPERVKCYDSVIESHRSNGSENARISPDNWNPVIKGHCEHTQLPDELRGEPYPVQGRLNVPPGGGPR